MKFPKNFENIAILKIWELVFYWDVKTDFGEKKTQFAFEILNHWSKSWLLDILLSQKLVKISSRDNTDYI
jgi:hypothetical protein